MKTKIFILAALVIFISAPSFAQVSYQGNNLDSNSRITLVPANQTDTSTGADSTSILASDSANADTSAAQAASPQAGGQAKQPMIIFGWDDEKTNYLIGILALIIFLLISSFKESIAAFIKSGALKVTIRPKKVRLQEELEEEQIMTKIHFEKVKRKAGTMTKLGNAVAKVLGEIFESKPKWSEWKSVLRFVIPFFGWLLEWLLFFRWNFRRLLWVMGFAVILFGIWALKPIPQKEKEDVPAELPAAITPTVVAMDSPDDEEETVYQQPDSHKEAVRLPGPDEWYVDAPAGRYGKEVILANGYHYDFYPEDNVNGLPDPNNPNSNSVPFQDGPGIKSPTRYFHSVAWTSRTGFDTRVKVVRTWKGTTAII